MSSNQQNPSGSLPRDSRTIRNYVIQPSPIILPISNPQPVQIIQPVQITQSVPIIHSQNIYTPPSSQSIYQSQIIHPISQISHETNECQPSNIESDSDISIDTESGDEDHSECEISKVKL